MNSIKKISIIMLILLLGTSCKQIDKNVDTPAIDINKDVESSVETKKEQEKDKEKEPSGVALKELTNKNGVWYEIFVRSFSDSDGDGIGDFRGLIEKLDYLNDGNPDTNTDLGIDGIWLMPINVSPSYHQYDVTDYYDIDPDYGTLEDFEEFLAEAHKRGIKVIMDLVVNHSSSQHPWFLDARSSKDSPYRDYYIWATDDTEGINVKDRWYKVGDEYYFAHFWDQMPDLNFDNPKVREDVKQIAKFWLEKGLDGFRMDAAIHIYSDNEVPRGTNTLELNTAWWEEFDTYCKSIKEDYYLVGEVWQDGRSRSRYVKSFDTLFNFDLGEEGIITIVKNGLDLKGRKNGFNTLMERTYGYYNEFNENYIDAPFITNHDQNRVMSYLNDVNMMKLASTMYMMLPGNPFIYYGEEIGMKGMKPDEQIREPFIWGDSDSFQTSWELIKHNKETSPVQIQQRLPDSLLNHYKEIIRVKKANEALFVGNYTGIETDNLSIIAYTLQSKNQKLTVVHNVSKNPVTISTSVLGVSKDSKLVYSSSEEFTFEFADEIIIPAQSSLILE